MNTAYYKLTLFFSLYACNNIAMQDQIEDTNSFSIFNDTPDLLTIKILIPILHEKHFRYKTNLSEHECFTLDCPDYYYPIITVVNNGTPTVGLQKSLRINRIAHIINRDINNSYTITSEHVNNINQ